MDRGISGECLPASGSDAEEDTFPARHLSLAVNGFSLAAQTFARLFKLPITGDVESGLAYTSVSRSMTAATCPEGHDCASERWAPDEPPGDEEDEVLAHASADARANTPIHLMAYPPKPW